MSSHPYYNSFFVGIFSVNFGIMFYFNYCKMNSKIIIIRLDYFFILFAILCFTYFEVLMNSPTLKPAIKTRHTTTIAAMAPADNPGDELLFPKEQG